MATERFPLQDRTAVVLGAADGPLARELCRALDAAGARVVEADAEVKVEQLGPVDVLVVHGPASDLLERCCESIAGAMSVRGGGRIVFVEEAGDAQRSTTPWCQAMATRWEEHGVRVNSLAHRKLDRGPDHHFAENAGEAPAISPQERREEYRAALVFLASDASLRITGFHLVADGSWMVPAS